MRYKFPFLILFMSPLSLFARNRKGAQQQVLHMKSYQLSLEKVCYSASAVIYRSYGGGDALVIRDSLPAAVGYLIIEKQTTLRGFMSSILKVKAK